MTDISERAIVAWLTKAMSSGQKSHQTTKNRSLYEQSSRTAHRKNTGKPKKNFPIVPTTKILALGQFTTPPTPEQIKEIFPKEVPATLKLYLAGKIDQWWARQTQTGPVFLMNMTSVEEAHTLLEELPLGKAGLMKFEFIELGPLTRSICFSAKAGQMPPNNVQPSNAVDSC